MVKDIIIFFLNIFNGIENLKYGKELIVFIISLMPILELRGGLIAATLLKLNPLNSYLISIIGNVIPVPLILIFFNKIFLFLKRKHLFSKVITYIEKKVDKNKGSLEKYGYLGLTIFVGIPLPGTGAWTGCLLASVLELDKKKSFLAILLGVVMASIIMMILSFGILEKII